MYSRSNPEWNEVFAEVREAYQLRFIEDPVERVRAIEAHAKERTGESLEEQLASIEDPRERWKIAAATGNITDEEQRILRTPCKERWAAWQSMRQLKEERNHPMNDPEYLALWYALLLPGVLKKRRDGEVIDREWLEKEAANTLRIVLHGANLSPIPPRGPGIGHLWFSTGPTFGEHRADEALRNFIEASTHDPDYWEAVTVITNRLIAEGRQLPEVLRSWFKDKNEGKRKAPPKTRGGPPYANETRNTWIAYAESVLRDLGMTRDDTLWAIQKVINKNNSRTPGRSVDGENLSFEAIKTASRNLPPDELPLPWECWPSPRDYPERRRKAKRKPDRRG